MDDDEPISCCKNRLSKKFNKNISEPPTKTLSNTVKSVFSNVEIITTIIVAYIGMSCCRFYYLSIN